MSPDNDQKTIVIIGGVAGGASAAARARRINENARIILLEKDHHVSFANCGLPYYIGGEIQQRQKLLVATPEKFDSWFNVEVYTRHEATAIDREQQTVTVRDHETGEDKSFRYDRLILAPGASPIVPPIDGIRSSNVFTLRNMEDTDGIKSFLDQHQPRRAVVIGAGYIGLEMVEMLRLQGLDVALVELQNQVLPLIDPEMAHMLQEELEAHGVKVYASNGLKGFETQGDQARQVILQDGTALDADLVILSIGVRANLDLAKQAGLEIGSTGGIRINEYTQTSDPKIYAVGDAVEYMHTVLRVPMRIPLAGPANRAGRIAGEHAASGRAPKLAPVLGTAIVRVFNKISGLTGLTEKLAKSVDRPVRAVWVVGNHHAGYYPGAEPMMLKLIYAPEDGQVLGAQAVGGEGVDKRIDVIATAIQLGATVDDLTGLDLAYAPPFGSAKDLVHMAAFVAQNDLRGLDHPVPPAFTAELGDVQVVDVRMPAEYEAGHLEGAKLIPLPTLRNRVEELDPNRPTVTICRGGQRAYIASRILQAHGFKDVTNLAGGMLMQEHVKPNRITTG